MRDARHLRYLVGLVVLSWALLSLGFVWVLS